MQEDVFTQHADKTLSDVKRKADRIVKSQRSRQSKALALMRVEKEGRDALKEIRNSTIITRPRGIGLSRTLTNQWSAYTNEADRIENDILQPLKAAVEHYINSSATNAKVPLKHFVRIDAAVRSRSMEAMGTARRLRKASEESVATVSTIAHSTAKESFRAVNLAVEEVIAELEQLQRSQIDVDSLSNNRRPLEAKIEHVIDRESSRLQKLKDQFDNLASSWSKDGIDTLDLTEALEEELEELREQREIDLEMAQIGMAINIVSHEFEKTVVSLRSGFRRMRAWTAATPEVEDLYRDMRGAFDHLDSYLAMFTPLDRRRHPVKVKIRGKDIHNFLSDLFEPRLARHKITLQATTAFEEFEVQGYPSTFYPIFANLLDNAVFWLQRISERRRTINLDIDGCDFLVSDNGPGVSVRDRDHIFLPRFSRKPGGRGMGLHVSKATLNKADYELLLDDTALPSSEGAVFRIAPREKP